MKTPSAPFALLFLFIAISCSILKPEDPEAKVRAFLTKFEQSLSGTDQQILSLFETQQTQEAILAAVRVLQNQTEFEIACSAYFDQATITFEDTGVRVSIPSSLSGSVEDVSSSREANLSFILTPKKGSFVITRLEGDDFYYAYMGVKDELAQASSDAAVHENVLRHIEVVKSLQEKFDTVVWVAEHQGMAYYYVVNGSWSDARDGSYWMGISDEWGKEIIPVNYTLIGTLAFDWPDMVEVKSENGVGLFSLTYGEVVPPKFESIIPYDAENKFALAKNDTAWGYIDKSYSFQVGISKEAQAFLNNHEFLPAGREFSNNTMTLCEIPSEEHYGSGYLIFPTYLSSTGLFNEIMGDFTMYTTEWRANTESISADHKFFDSIIDGVSMLLTSISTRYLEGRESFYETDELTFVSNDGSWSGTAIPLSSSEISVRKIDSTLIELVSAYTTDGFEFYGETSDELELDIPVYHYFRLTEGGPEELTSSRIYNFTEFVKLDSSYLTGNFTYIDRETFNTDTRNFLCDSTLIKMRNEILAGYGFMFPDQQTQESFKYYKWYQPRFVDVAQFEEALSEVDRHNLKFLERIIGPIPKKENI